MRTVAWVWYVILLLLSMVITVAGGPPITAIMFAVAALVIALLRLWTTAKELTTPPVQPARYYDDLERLVEAEEARRGTIIKFDTNSARRRMRDNYDVGRSDIPARKENP